MENRKLEMTLKILLVIGIALCLPILELALPVERFAFRAWEPLLLRRPEVKLPGVFYPNITLTLDEVGDLAPYTDQQIVRHHSWQTDGAGYRNSEWCENPQAILFGDSMASGIGLDQTETINERLKKILGVCSYSFGHDKLENAVKTAIHWGWKPKLAMLVIVERNLAQLEAFPTIETPLKIRSGKFFFQEHGLAPLVAVAERLRNSNFTHYRNRHGFIAAVRRAIWGHTFYSVPPAEHKMFFYSGESALDPVSDDTVQGYAELLKIYHDGLKALGMDLLVVVVPNKETIYPELVPSNRHADTLPRLYKALGEKGVAYIDLFHPYRAAYEKSGKFYYHLDDTHWNAESTALAAELIKQKLQGPGGLL